MIMMANWKDRRWHGLLISRGSFVSSVAHLSARFNLSTQTVRTLLDRLKSTSELTIKTTSRFTIYVIVNYDKYQTKDSDPTSEITSLATSKQQTSNKRLTTTKEFQEIKRISPYPLVDNSVNALAANGPGVVETPPVRQANETEEQYKRRMVNAYFEKKGRGKLWSETEERDAWEFIQRTIRSRKL
jgi:predicted transcriptional regulator